MSGQKIYKKNTPDILDITDIWDILRVGPRTLGISPQRRALGENFFAVDHYLKQEIRNT